MMTEASTPKETPWIPKSLASSRLPAPKALPIKAVVPVEKPLPMARIIKKTGKERDRAAKTCVEMRPPKKVSTTLNMV
jgi:hypothetical protein